MHRFITKQANEIIKCLSGFQSVVVGNREGRTRGIAVKRVPYPLNFTS